MIVCLVLAVAAVLLFTDPPRRRRVSARLTEPAHPVGPVAIRPARRRWPWWLGAAVGLAGLVLAHAMAGAPAVAVTAAVLIVLGAGARLLDRGRTQRAASRARVDVAHACGVLASQIRVGRVPAEVLAGAAGDCPVLADSSRAQDLGGDPTTVWRASATSPGHAGLGDLARAWQVSTQTGAPLAHSLERVSEALTADVALRAVVSGELSATRATGKIMAVLPFCGLGMGYLLGGDPLHFLLSNSYGWGCLVAGVALAAAGVLWIDRLSQLAEDQG